VNNFAGWSHLLNLVNILLPAFAVLFAGHLTIVYRRQRPLMLCFLCLGLMSLWLLAGEISGSMYLRTAPTRPLVARALAFIGLGIAALGKPWRR